MKTPVVARALMPVACVLPVSMFGEHLGNLVSHASREGAVSHQRLERSLDVVASGATARDPAWCRTHVGLLASVLRIGATWALVTAGAWCFMARVAR